MHNFRRLEVWQEAMSLAETVYRLAETLPPEEKYGLQSQIRRAAVSISSNIAEGAARGRPREMARFLRLSMGSISELDSQLELAHRLGLLDEEAGLSEPLDRLRRRIRALHDRILTPELQ